MTKEITTVKGFQDYLPPESLKRSAVKKLIEKYFQSYGFVPIETPIIEFDALMANENENDEAVSDGFKLKDRGDRNLGLRYEFTFQLQRIFKENPSIKLPFKRYQIGEVFRDEPISSSRFRQFTQCDADIIGDSSSLADAECLALFSDIFKTLNIQFEIQVNNRKLLTSIIQSVEIAQIESVMKEIDKIEKVGADAVKLNLRKFATTNQIVTLFKLLEKELLFFKDNAFQGIEELEELIDLCDMYGLDLKFSPFLARGLAYYTGNIFEIKSGNISIAGGGRYDSSVGKFTGRDIPAVGISMGIERVCQLAQIPLPDLPKVLIISINQDKAAIQLAKKLRKEDISCIIQSTKISKAMEYANSNQIPFVIFIGEEEIKFKKFKLRNMQTGEEKSLNESQLEKALSK